MRVMRVTGSTRKLGSFVVGLLVVAMTIGCGGGGGGNDSSPSAVASSTSTSTSTSTTTGGAGDLYTVSFDLDDAVTVGSLQLELDYSGANGGFVGSGSNVSCTSPLSASGGLAVFADMDASARLNFAILALAGFTGPITMADCTFLATGSGPTPGDFVVTVLEANGTDTSAIAPLPAVTISAVTPQ